MAGESSNPSLKKSKWLIASKYFSFYEGLHVANKDKEGDKEEDKEEG